MKIYNFIFSSSILIIIFFLSACSNKVNSEEEFKEQIVGTWIATDESVSDYGVIMKNKLVIRADGTCEKSLSTNNSAYKYPTNSNYKIGKGGWGDSDEPRWYIKFSGDEYNYVDGSLILNSTYIDGEKKVEIYHKQ